MKYTWGNRTYEFYKPKVNRKRQLGLFGLIAADVILPMTFGLGFAGAKLIMKLNPLYLYK